MGLELSQGSVNPSNVRRLWGSVKGKGMAHGSLQHKYGC